MTASVVENQIQRDIAESPDDARLIVDGYDQSLRQLRRLAGRWGFWASETDRANYRRVWARDSQVMSLAALMSGEPDLVEASRRSLLTLARNQGSHGEIPSNVEPENGRSSFGSMAGRVDSTLWFLIGAGEYWKRTRDEHFLSEIRPVAERAWFVLGAWEFNCRGLLYIPQTGDWADEYLQQGYVLYDQALYLQAGRAMLELRSVGREKRDQQIIDKLDRLKQLIDANYWFDEGDDVPAGVYHDLLYRKSRDAADRCRSRFWVPFFTPHGYGYRFDAFANVLVSLLGIASEHRAQQVEDYVEGGLWEEGSAGLLPAFYPVIEPEDKNWERLKMNFSYSFKNHPHEYQNGGRWPMISGFHVAELAARGRRERALDVLLAIHRANRMEMEGTPWSFAEFHHGLSGEPGGTPRLGWSAAAGVIGHKALEGERPFLLRSVHDTAR